MSSSLKTALLLGLLTGIILWIGQLFGGPQGMVIAFAFSLLLNFGSYWFSDKIVLAMYHARQVGPDNRLYGIVERLAGRANLPMPKVYVIPEASPNAFATGRNPRHASVAVTQGILGLLSDEELEGVLAHELGHVRNRDILTSSIAATLAGAITLAARMFFWFGVGGDDRDRRGGGLGAILMLILAPIAAMLIQLWVSRTREYEADATGSHFTGNPYALARALQKLDAYSRRVPMMATPSTAHLFIIKPMMGVDFANLFSTHPPIYKRIERLTGHASVPQ